MVTLDENTEGSMGVHLLGLHGRNIIIDILMIASGENTEGSIGVHQLDLHCANTLGARA